MQRSTWVIMATPGHTDSLSFDDLFDREEIQRLQDAFALATGTGTVLADPQGQLLTRPSNLTGLCGLLRGELACQKLACLTTELARLPVANLDDLVIGECLSGLMWRAAAFVRMDHVHIATWLVGQVLRDDVSDEQALQIAQRLQADMPRFREALARTPRMSRLQFEHIAEFLKHNAQMLSRLAATTVRQSREIHECRLAQQALQDSESRLRAIFNAAKTVSFIITDAQDPEPHVLEFSPGAENIFGYTRQEMLGKPVSILHLPQDAASFPACHRHMREGREGFTGESLLVRKNGQQFPAWFSTYPLFDADGQMCAALGVSMDVSRVRQLEKAVWHIAQEAGGCVGEEYFAKLAKLVAQSLEADWVVVSQHLPAQPGMMKTLARWGDGAPAENLVYPLEGTPCEQVLAGQASAYPRDVARLFPQNTWLAQAGIESYVGTPVLNAENVPVGMISIMFHHPLEDTQLAERVLKVFAIRAGAEIDRLRAENQLRESEQRLRTVLNSAPVILWAIDDRGRFTFSEGHGLKRLGLRPGEVVGKTVANLFADNPQVMKDIREVLDGKAVCSMPVVNGIHYETRYSPLADADGRITGAIGVAMDVTDRQEAVERLRRLATVVEQMSEEIIITDLTGHINYVNPAFEHSSGYSAEEVLGRTAAFLRVGGELPESDVIRKTMEQGRVWTGRVQSRRKNGEIRDKQVTVCPLVDSEGRPREYVSLARDITEHARLEAQLRQSQKMEAIGSLAGGIAHDFNNLLQAIIGYAELTSLEPQTNENVRQNMMEIRKAADRAADLTRQLLLFARREAMQLQSIDLAEILDNIARMLRRLLGEQVELVLHIAPALHPIRADISQIEQVVMNLCINARDAMPNGGRLSLSAANVHVDQRQFLAGGWNQPGDYVRLTVADSGVGIPKEIQERIFEPFFTTKEVGQGSGLGLATVYSIVERHGGMIHLESEVGQGAAFDVYLPAATEPAAPLPKPHAMPDEMPGGDEVLLLAEDDQLVRELAQRVLQSAGYHLLIATDGQEAIDLFEQHKDQINLAILDVVMPRKSGREVYESILRQRPELPVLFSSGYSYSAIDLGSYPPDRCHVIQKPYAPQALLRQVRGILDTAQAASANRSDSPGLRA